MKQEMNVGLTWKVTLEYAKYTRAILKFALKKKKKKTKHYDKNAIYVKNRIATNEPTEGTKLD